MARSGRWHRNAFWCGVMLLGAAGASSTAPQWPRWPAVVLVVLAAAAFGLAVRWRPQATPPAPPPPEGGAWWADPVLESLAADAVGREPFVTRLAELLRAIDTAEDTAVVGLVGPWGSGKSTTLRWVRSRLDTAHRWDVVDMGAWAAPGPDGVVLELLRALNEAWSGTRWRRFVRTVSPSARALATASAPAASLLEPVPGVGPLLARLGWAALLPSATAPPIPQQLRALEARVGKRTRSTLVVVDDVDRLQPDELLALFKAVRVLGALPRVHYLLVYDEETVLHQLQQTAVGRQDDGGVDRATSFLEKIVTLRLDQPPVSRDAAGELLRDDVTAAFTAMGIELDADTRERLDDEIDAFFTPLLDTPRSVRRFTAQLRTYLPLMRVEAVDLVDFAVLALLRVRYQSLYDQLSRDRYLLASRGGRAALTPGWRDGSVVERMARRDATVVGAALQRLFPGTLGADDGSGRGRAGSSRESWRRRRTAPPRVGELDYIDRFFHLAAPVNDDDEPAVLQAVEEWRAGEPGEAWAGLTALVSAAGSSARAAHRAARLLRRADTATARLTDEDAGLIVKMVFALFPVSGGQKDDDVGWAARQWLRNAVERADLDPADVLEMAAPVAASAVAANADVPRLQALAEVLLDHPPQLSGAPGLTEQLVIAAWRCSEEAARRGDLGEPVATGDLLQTVDLIAPDQLGSLVLDGLHRPQPPQVEQTDGSRDLDVLDVLSCWVATRGTRAEMPAAVAGDVVRLVGVEAAAAAAYAPAPQVLGPWSERRRAAHRALERAGLLMDALPDLPRGVEPGGELLLDAPELLRRVSAFQAPDLRLVLSAAVLAEVGDSAARAPSSSWDYAFSRLTEVDAMTRWLVDVAPVWDRSPRLWTSREEAPPLLEAEAWLEGFVPDPARPWLREPVSAAAQLTRLQPGRNSGHGGLRWTVDVGIWLSDLDHLRRPADAEPSIASDDAVAAALQPAELAHVTTSAVRWALHGASAVLPLLSEDERERQVHLQVRFTGRLKPQQAVRWGNVDWRTGSVPSTAVVPLIVRRSALPIAEDQSDRLARYLVGQWRERTGGDRAAG